jgi:serine/threonine protein kinase
MSLHIEHDASVRFVVLRRLGSGSFGEVLEALDKLTGERVALKRIFMRHVSPGYFPAAVYRELTSHVSLMPHPNVVEYKGFFADASALVVVLEALPTDLSHLSAAAALDLDVIRLLMFDIFRGIAFLHASGVMHRDVKSANVLVGGDGVARIADLGLCRPFRGAKKWRKKCERDWCYCREDAGARSPGSGGTPRADAPPAPAAASDGTPRVDTPPAPAPAAAGAACGESISDGGAAAAPPDCVPCDCLTGHVMTRWYRAPELLFGATVYGPSIDVWGAGAVAAELIAGRPLAGGGSDLEQIRLLIGVLGTPGENDYADAPPDGAIWPDLGTFSFSPIHRADMAYVLGPRADAPAVDLIDRIIRWDPGARPTAEAALAHPFFAPIAAATSGELVALRQRIGAMAAAASVVPSSKD